MRITMREILFRGKRVDNGEFVEGYYAPIGDKYHYILTGKLAIVNGIVGVDFPEFEHILIIPETLGQYIGFTDKKDSKIFDGDIVEIYLPCNRRSFVGIISCGCYASAGMFHKTHLGFYIEWIEEDLNKRIDLGFWVDAYRDEIEVIGNIHDNPELLEVSK